MIFDLFTVKERAKDMKQLNIHEPFDDEQLSFLLAMIKACIALMFKMFKNAGSGHPGGSLSSLLFLILVYCTLVLKKGLKVTLSIGHIIPAVYSILGVLGVIPKDDLINGFRQLNSPFEGHANRETPTIFYSSGHLGTACCAAAGYADIKQKILDSDELVIVVIGDGESQEGTVYEFLNWVAARQPSNLLVYVDFNKVQLSGAIKDELPGFNLLSKLDDYKDRIQVIDLYGGRFDQLRVGISDALNEKTKPTVIIGRNYMGLNVPILEDVGRLLGSEWHGKVPPPDVCDQIIADNQLTTEEQKLVKEFVSQGFIVALPDEKIEIGTPMEDKSFNPIIYPPGTIIACRKAAAQNLLELARENLFVVAGDADVRPSAGLEPFKREFPDRYIRFGIAERSMVLTASGISLAKENGKHFIPYVFTFSQFGGGWMPLDTVNLNGTNVKVVVTHGGLSVGPDGPSHQSTNDLAVIHGLQNFMDCQPADANHTGHVMSCAEYVWGDFYIRLPRHAQKILIKPDGTPFFDEDYEFHFGRCDLLRGPEDSRIIVVAIGAMVEVALQAVEEIHDYLGEESTSLVIASSVKKFDPWFIKSLKTAKGLVIAEDHISGTGLASGLSKVIMKDREINPHVRSIGAPMDKGKSSSAKHTKLYEEFGMSSHHFKQAILEISRNI